MTDKIGLVKNPLTIIAIFAGIAEVSGTIVLPHISENNQKIFMYFLMGFPTLLVMLFFGTLLFKHRVLYAPGDYQDEKNFMLTAGVPNRYSVQAHVVNENPQPVQ